MFKKISIVFFSVILFLINIFPSFAAVATPSVASVSNAFPMEQFMEIDLFDDVELYSTLASIDNTVDYGSVGYALSYVDMSGVHHWSPVMTVQSDGYFSISRPSDYASASHYELRLFSGALPPPGKYRFQVDFASNTGGFTYNYVDIWSGKNVTNAQLDESASDPLHLQQSSGDFYFSTTIDINSGLNYMAVRIFFPSSMILPYGGYVKFNFQRLSSSAETDVDTAGIGTSDPSQDTAQNTEDIANNTAQIVEGQDNIMDTIREQVQYITLQLEAFWNQLAGEFTNLFNKMNDQLSQLLNGIEDQTTEVTGAIDDVESEINQSTAEINQNIDQSTNQITNGYDNSSLNNSANEYHQADQELENAQNAAWDQGAGRIEDFDFGEFDFSPGVMAALSYCGNWLQNVFVGISFFNLPITIGLTIVFALMIIGYYRYH